LKGSDSLKLKDKVALITDGASASGLAIAERFKTEGAILAMNVCPRGSSDSGAIKTEEWGVVSHANPVSKIEVDATVGSVLEKYGRIDVVIHNNNEVIRANLEDCGDDVYDEALGINVKSAFLFAQAAGAWMKQAGKGNFVFISSIHDEKPNGAAFTYSIAKGALKMLVKEMVLDMGPYNVRANIVNMGPMEGHDKLFYSDLSPLYEHTKERIINSQYGTLEEVANAALFFAGDDCPSANGSELKLDGGFLLTYFSRRRKQTPEPQNIPAGSPTRGPVGG
jgi:NAD(P)-dependent dehydrogenase (short-subunit alcohol dehydrogenase family)